MTVSFVSPKALCRKLLNFHLSKPPTDLAELAGSSNKAWNSLIRHSTSLLLTRPSKKQEQGQMSASSRQKSCAMVKHSKPSLQTNKTIIIILIIKRKSYSQWISFLQMLSARFCTILLDILDLTGNMLPAERELKLTCCCHSNRPALTCASLERACVDKIHTNGMIV